MLATLSQRCWQTRRPATSACAQIGTKHHLSRTMPAKSQPSLARAVKISLTLLGIMFLVMVAQLACGPFLNRFGIVPRTSSGLVGVVFAPLLHADLHHLLANALPLLVLLTLLWSNREYRPGRTLALIWVASGLGTWVIGRGQSIHLGASSIVFGLVAFLIMAGFRAKSWSSAFVAVLVFVLYGGVFYGVLPQAGPISWEGHLCGAVAGVWAASRLPA
jgi:membrane associated rhomboid family serine protease